MDALPSVEVAPSVSVKAPLCGGCLSQEEADLILGKARNAFPNTPMVKAWPVPLPGLVALEMSNKSIAYTDKTARYLIMGIVFDSFTGKALDNQMEQFNK